MVPASGENAAITTSWRCPFRSNKQLSRGSIPYFSSKVVGGCDNRAAIR
jgi:hypothetical protein